METDGRRMCEVLVGLGEVDLVGVEELAGDRLRVTIRSRGPRPVRLRWKKRRWVFPNPGCGVGSSCGAGPVSGVGTGPVDVSGRAMGYRAGGSSWSYGVGGGRRVGV